MRKIKFSVCLFVFVFVFFLAGGGWNTSQTAIGVGPTNLFAANSSFNATQFGNSLQLQSPPGANKRGKR